MLWYFFSIILLLHETVTALSVSDSSSGSTYHSESKSNSHSESSSHRSKKGGYTYRTVHRSPSTSFGYTSDFHFPLGYGLPYASDFDTYDPDLDPDFIFIGSHYVDPDLDFDLDFDFSDVDLDIDLLKLKYGLYGLNHLSLREPHFNDYRFRQRLRHGRKPRYRSHHRYLPKYWKHDLDFWGLDNYSLGYGYGYDIDTPTSYVHVRRY